MTAISGAPIPGRRPAPVSTSFTASTAAQPTRHPLRRIPPTATRSDAADLRRVGVAAVRTRWRYTRAPFAYTIVPIAALLAGASSPPDGGRAQSRTDRRAGAIALLLFTVAVVVVSLVVGLAVTRLIHIAVTDLSLGASSIST